MTATALGRVQARYGTAIEVALRGVFASQSGPSEFYGMMQYQLGHVDEWFRPDPRPGGKRFRPALCLLACDAVGGSTDDAIHVAAAIELLHNFSLIHDDIEDGDPFRRHRRSVWNVWGMPQAINAGDGLFALAGTTVLTWPGNQDRALAVAAAFQRTTVALTEGQYLDMIFEGREQVSPDEYLRMITGKTAAIIAFSLWAGGWCGGADPDTVAGLESFGLEVGRAFQINDDVMGIWAGEHTTGKKEAQDLINRKKSLPVVLAMDRISEYTGSALQAFFERRTDDVDAARQCLDDFGVRTTCELMAHNYLNRGLQYLNSASIAQSDRIELEGIAREIVSQAW